MYISSNIILEIYYTEHREWYEIVLHKSYFHSRKMDATTSPQVTSKFSDVCNLLYESKNKTFTPTVVRKNTTVKYAKLPDYDFNSKGMCLFVI